MLENATEHFRAQRLVAALEMVTSLLKLEPENLNAMLLCGRIMRRGGKLEEAVALYKTIIAHVPDIAEAFGGLGAAYGNMKRYGDAEKALRHAVMLNARYYEAWTFLAEALVEQGKTAEAIDSLDKALTLEPSYAPAMERRLFYATFDPRYDSATAFRMNRAWGSRLEQAVVPVPSKRSNDDRRIHVGYLSDEFYECVTGRFLEPVLEAHDRTRFCLTGYSQAGVKDATAMRLESAVDRWRDLSGLDAAAVAARIAEDGLDILVLCTSYSPASRIPLAYKPAPIQACYSNLVSTTGLATVDYMITEAATDPPGSEAFYVEQLVRLTNRNIYAPPENGDIPIDECACLKNGFITFGTFNHIGKISREMVSLWAEILCHMPDARFVLKSTDRFDEPGAVAYFVDLFAAHGVTSDRLSFLAKDDDLGQHLRCYGNIDIALDTYPCNGGTTSCEALWMGVPLVSMTGDFFMSRQGSNYLTKLGLNDLIVTTPDAYVDAALRLAADRGRIITLRKSLRRKVERILFDPAPHVAELEIAYEEMVRRLRSQEPTTAFSVSNP